MSPLLGSPSSVPSPSILPSDHTSATSSATAKRRTTSSSPRPFLYGKDFPEKLQTELQQAATRLMRTPFDMIMKSYVPIQTVNLCIHPLNGSPLFFPGLASGTPTCHLSELQNGNYFAAWHDEDVERYPRHANWSLNETAANPLPEMLMLVEESSQKTGWPTHPPVFSPNLIHNVQYLLKGNVFGPGYLDNTVAAARAAAQKTQQRAPTVPVQTLRNWDTADQMKIAALAQQLRKFSRSPTSPTNGLDSFPGFAATRMRAGTQNSPLDLSSPSELPHVNSPSVREEPQMLHADRTTVQNLAEPQGLKRRASSTNFSELGTPAKRIPTNNRSSGSSIDSTESSEGSPPPLSPPEAQVISNWKQLLPIFEAMPRDQRRDFENASTPQFTKLLRDKNNVVFHKTRARSSDCNTSAQYFIFNSNPLFARLPHAKSDEILKVIESKPISNVPNAPGANNTPFKVTFESIRRDVHEQLRKTATARAIFETGVVAGIPVFDMP